MKKNYKNIIMGVIVILLGVALLGNLFKWWTFNLFFEGWWTLFIFVPCIISLFTDGFKFRNILGNVVGIALATLFLLSAQNVIDWKDIWKFIIPILLIILGLHLIFGRKFKFSPEIQQNFTKYDGKKYTFSATFGGNNVSVPQDFVSGDAVAVFGGVEVDFRDFVANSDIYLKANATFGGVDIYVPHNVKVIVSSNNVFGGTDDHTSHSNDDSFEHTMYIQTNAVFGGVDIK